MDRRQLLCRAGSALFLLPALLMGCAQTPPPTPLTGTEWILAELPGQSLPAAGARPTLMLAGEPLRATGGAGVNNFVGTVQMAGAGGLTFGPLATTRRAGAPQAMQLEAAYLAALAAARTFRTGPGTLELLDAAGRVVVRYATVAAPGR
ncbi:MAG: META domain-containing protein [Burkholderiaceae bacterium]|nr:META domain-containing protein [Burkholderiaceae bacterium]